MPKGTFRAIATGYDYGLAIRTDGTLAAWGAHPYRGIGIPKGSFTAIAAGQGFCLALTTDGTLIDSRNLRP